MEDNPSQKHFDKWSDDDAELDEIDNLDFILEATRQEVLSWMNTYGKPAIREWLQDNAKKLLVSDGLTFTKQVSNTTEKSSKSFKKPPMKKQRRANDFIDVDRE